MPASSTSTDTAAPARPRIDLFISSLSAHGIAVTVGKEVVAILRAAGWKAHVTVTTSDDDPAGLAGASSAELVGAIGGDGFISAIASGVAQRGAILVPFPGGRGNDLCRALGIGTDAAAHARRLTRESSTRSIDALRVVDANGMSRLALGIVSLGFDAVANQVANDATRITSGPLAYTYGAVRALQRFRPQPMRARVDGRSVDLGGWLASVSNSGWFGGGINLVPTSKLDDARVEVIRVAPIPFRKAVVVLAQVLALRNTSHPAITVARATEVEFLAPAGISAMADGDRIGMTPLTITVEPSAVRVLT